MYSFDSTIRYSECDERARLSVVGLIDYLQDCAIFHSESVGHGLDYMTEHHFAWFIAAWQIRIERLPRLCERVSVATNCYSMSSVTAHRSFSIRDAQGAWCVKADSIWFTFDTEAGRPCRIPAGEDVYLGDETRVDLPRTTRKIPVPGEGMAQSPIVVSEQHIDTNHHVNNAQYVAMADAVVRAADPGFALGGLRVQYRSMALLGDTIVPRLHRSDSGYVVDLADEAGSTYAIVGMDRA